MSARRVPAPERVRYRRTTEADVDLLVYHRHRMWTDIAHHTEAEITEHDGRYATWARPRLASGELVGCVAEAAGGRRVGSGLVWYQTDQPRPRVPGLVNPYILSMFVEPAWRGHGIATGIVKELLAEIRRAGYPNASLHASRFARRLYGRLGFERSWEMRVWLDRRYAPRKLPAASRGKKKKRLDRVR